MGAAEQMVLSWIASQSVLVQIGLSLTLIFLIGPALLTAAAVAVTRIERSLERLLSGRSGWMATTDPASPQTQTESAVFGGVKPNNAMVADTAAEMIPHSAEGQLRQV